MVKNNAALKVPDRLLLKDEAITLHQLLLFANRAGEVVRGCGAYAPAKGASSLNQPMGKAVNSVIVWC